MDRKRRNSYEPVGFDLSQIPTYGCHVMTVFVRPATLFVAVLLGGWGASALAQNGPAGGESQYAEGQDAPTSVPPEKRASMAARILEAQRAHLAQVYRLLKQARSDRDIIQTNCLSQKAEQLKGLFKISQKAYVGLLEEPDEQGTGAAGSEFSRIFLAGKRSESVRSEALQCVGSEAVYSGVTEISVTEPSELPNQVGPGFPVPPGPAVPPTASSL